MSNNNLVYSDNINTDQKRRIDEVSHINKDGHAEKDMCRCSNGKLGKIIKINPYDKARFEQIINTKLIM